jgi:hypothetical protein
LFFETIPISYVLFRPKEIHCASGIREVVKPLPKRHRGVGHKTFGVGALQLTIFHFNFDRRSTIETRGIDLNDLSRKQPADRQRFKPSLAEPLLLSLDADAVLGGQVAERRERADVVGVRKKPGGEPFKEEIVKRLFPFFGRDFQRCGYLGVMRGMPRLNKMAYDNLKDFISLTWFCHEAFLLALVEWVFSEAPPEESSTYHAGDNDWLRLLDQSGESCILISSIL